MTTPMVVVETLFPEDIFNTLQARGLFKDVLAEETRRLLALRACPGLQPGRIGHRIRGG